MTVKTGIFFQNALLPHQKCQNELFGNPIRLCSLEKERKTQAFGIGVCLRKKRTHFDTEQTVR